MAFTVLLSLKELRFTMLEFWILYILRLKASISCSLRDQN